ncbi:MAG: hypothetical protein Q9220_006655 [cf. Caloplaca sp. 1 TL-2023]
MVKSGPQSRQRSDEAASASRSIHSHIHRHGSDRHQSSRRESLSPARRASSTQRSKRLYKKISRLREQALIARLQLRHRRVEMQEQHNLVRSLESRLLRFWQDNGKFSPQGDNITSLHSELCAALDALGPMEYALDEKEDDLDAIEYDMEARETRFYKYHARVLEGSQDSQGSLSSYRSSISSSSNDLHLREAYDEDTTSPQFRYYSRIGDARNVREILLDLEAEKAHYLDIEQERRRLGIPLYQENVEFLRNYDSVYMEHLAEFEKIKKDIQILEVEAGFPDGKDESDIVLVHGLERLPEAGADRRAGSVSDFRLARFQDLSANGTLRRKSETDVKAIGESTRNSRDRINQWILERLASSLIEQARHRAILNDPKLDEPAWWNLVRKFWQLDRAARSSSSSRRASGVSASTRPQSLYDSTEGASIDLALGTTLESDSLPAMRSTADLSRRINFTGFQDRPNTTNIGQADGPSDPLNYLDLAITSSLHEKMPQGKWDSVLGC